MLPKVLWERDFTEDMTPDYSAALEPLIMLPGLGGPGQNALMGYSIRFDSIGTGGSFTSCKLLVANSADLASVSITAKNLPAISADATMASGLLVLTAGETYYFCWGVNATRIGFPVASPYVCLAVQEDRTGGNLVVNVKAIG